MTVPNPKVEIRFNGSTWVDVTTWVRLRDGISLQRGRDDEASDTMAVGTCTLALDNNSGEFTPDLTTSTYYPYITSGVAIRVSMWTGAAYSTRFYGTVQKWQVQWLNPLGTQAKCAVTATGTLGDFPNSTLRQAADEIVRQVPGIRYCWPMRGQTEPMSSIVGNGTMTTNGNGGLGESTTMLPLEEGADGHAHFTGVAGGLVLTPMVGGVYGLLNVVVLDAPTTAGKMLTLNTSVGTITVSWSATLGFTASDAVYGTVSTGLPTSWPQVLEVGDSGSGLTSMRIRCCGSDGSVLTGTMSPPELNLSSMTLGATSGGADWGGAFLTLNDNYTSTTDLASYAVGVLGQRIPAGATVASWLSSIAGGPSITGGTVGESVIPTLGDHDAADAMSALVAGMGARLVDDLDGTLTYVPFSPSGTAITLPTSEIDPELTWETSDVGWYSEATVTWPDGTSYTASRPDGKRTSITFEGVHADRDEDRAFADWLVWNTASTGRARMPQAPYDLATLSDANAATLCSVTVASRISISGLPPQMPSTQTLIVEGIDEQINDSQWLVTFKTSPDVYSQLFILDDPVQSELDAGYLLAP